MGYLLDTHSLNWYLSNSSNLSSQARKIIDNNDFSKYISIATFWEIGIKIKLQKLDLSISFESFIIEVFEYNFRIIDSTIADTILISQLPSIIVTHSTE